MAVLVAVIDDLWQFAFQSLFGARTFTHDHQAEMVQQTLPLQTTTAETDFIPLTVSDRYFIGVSGQFLYSDPTSSVETEVRPISYGEAVIIKKLGGDWAQVMIQDQIGWVHRRTLVTTQMLAVPTLAKNRLYTADQSETKDIRRWLQRFDLQQSGPLTSVEYILQRLVRSGAVVPQQLHTMTTPGSWQRILRGAPGVHISVTPQVGSVMEYVLDDIGFIAYVESIQSDQTIVISECSLVAPGQYTERTLEQAEYRELAPVFITIT